MRYKLFSFDKIPSTQDYAHAMIVDGRAKDLTIVLAEVQTMGRGRRRRPWVSHNGNLYASFIFEYKSRTPALPYAVAVAVVEAIASYGIRTKIKWPNDILLDGKKVAGILIEYSGDFAIVGIGINIKSNPTVSSYKTTKLSIYAPVDRDGLLRELMSRLDYWLPRNWTAVRRTWTAMAAHIGEKIKYKGDTVTMIGIDEHGALILRDGLREFAVIDDEIVL